MMAGILGADPRVELWRAAAAVEDARAAIKLASAISWRSAAADRFRDRASELVLDLGANSTEIDQARLSLRWIAVGQAVSTAGGG
jgi:hypothetical protein